MMMIFLISKLQLLQLLAQTRNTMVLSVALVLLDGFRDCESFPHVYENMESIDCLHDNADVLLTLVSLSSHRGAT